MSPANDFPWRDCLTAVGEAVEQGLHVIDRDGVTVVCNRKAAQLDGMEVQEVLGRKLLDVYPSLTAETSRLLTAARTGKPIPSSQQTYMNYKGRTVTVVNSTYPLLYKGEVAGAFELMTDVTPLAQATDRYVSLVQSQVVDHTGAGNPADSFYSFDDIITKSPKVLKAIDLARRAASRDCPVFVYGETGTGKELIVQAIHRASSRAGLLVEQNCAALPETLLESTLFGVVLGSFTGARDRPGLLELARNGTLHLDELSSMPSDLQSKLLRVMQDSYVRRVGDTKKRPTTFRVVASCNMDPFKAIESGELRRDLFYRLSTVLIELVPLRERDGDVCLLTGHFLDRINRRVASRALDLSPEVWDLFQSHSWPGNVRELEHVLEHAAMAATGDVITLDSLPGYLARAHPRSLEEPAGPVAKAQASLQAEIERFERGLVEDTLESCGWNTSEAARRLGVPRQTLQYRMAKLGIRRGAGE